jgi:hypothetical protein
VEPWAWVVIGLVALLAGGVSLVLIGRNRRTDELKGRFGTEYDRVVDDVGDRRGAEAALSERVERRQAIEFRVLTRAEADRFASSWEGVQVRFVDDPTHAVGEADYLVQQVMRERGYPMDGFEQRVADISVEHADVVDNYRAAHRIFETSEHGNTTTEELREAMVHYRALFEQLLETGLQDRAEEPNGA